jgi:hypothetical protein
MRTDSTRIGVTISQMDNGALATARIHKADNTASDVLWKRVYLDIDTMLSDIRSLLVPAKARSAGANKEETTR